MGKSLCLLTATLVMSLWAYGSYGQERVVSVEELFRLADENSRSVMASQAAVSQAAEAVKAAKAGRLPSLDASLSFSYLGDGWIADRDFSGGENAPMPHYGNNLQVEASQLIYGGGAVRAGIESAQLQHRFAELGLEDTRQGVRFAVLGYYLELYKLSNQQTVYRKNIEQTQLLVDNIRARETQGLALQNDITRYELQLQQLRLALTEAQNNANIINHYLVSTLSLPAGTVIVPDAGVLSMQIQNLSEQEWQSRAEASTPRLKMADLSLSLSRQTERITRAGRLPKVALVAANHLDGPIIIEVPPINKNFNYWYVGLGIQYSFDSLWKSGGKIRSDRYATVKAQHELELAREETGNAVNAAYIMLQQAYEQLHTQEKSVQLAVQNYGVINSRYLNDLALVTDMIDASNSQLSAELQLVNSRINVVYSYYKLQRVTGIL